MTIGDLETIKSCGLFASLFLMTSACTLAAAEWTWTWKPAPGDKAPQASVCTFKYGKTWAYAVEIDDGPKWTRSFAVPFLAAYHYTDAPPGVKGGQPLPFVGSVAVIVGSVGNDSSVSWADMAAMMDAGWGVMNHSFDHRGRSWEAAGKMSDDEIREDAYWSQVIFAANLPGGRAPTAAVYANGYTDYNRNDALAACGVGIATRVGGSSTRDVTSKNVKWMDFPRSYLDDGVWTDKDNKGEPMAQFPGADKDGPAANSFVIDFTHGIDQKAESANQQRWIERLKTIEERWGDALWCAPTGEIADYVRAAKNAKVTAKPGKLTISLPDGTPGSAISVRLTGIGSSVVLKAPAGGACYRDGSDVVVTSPLIGMRGAVPPQPRLKRVYDGPVAATTFPRPERVAGVTFWVFGCPKEAVMYSVSAKTAAGVVPIGERKLESRWVVGSQLCAAVPGKAAIVATGIEVKSAPELKKMTVWAIE